MSQLIDVKTEGKKEAGAPPFHLGYRRGLDGLRGVAIVLVLLDHGEIIGDGFGFIGVNTFFVLSGFLITCLLIGEWDKFGDISLRHFYARRALRLLPALLSMLVLFVIFEFLTGPHRRAVREFHEALRALFYFTNWGRIYHIGRNLSLAHVWSLSIEEQFYFLWPVLLLFLLRRNSRKSLLTWILLGIFLSFMAKVSLYVIGREEIGERLVLAEPDRLTMGLDTRADSLLVGCFAAVVLASGLMPRQVWFVKVLNPLAVLSALGLAGLGFFRVTSGWMIQVGWLAASIAAVIIITQGVAGARGFMQRALENPGLVYVGTISYGLYVWHFPILKALQQHRLPWRNLIYLLPVFAAALISYYLIERPCLRLKRRFARSE